MAHAVRRGYGADNPNGQVAYQDTDLAGKVKSFSGRYLSWLNGTQNGQDWLNPENHENGSIMWRGAAKIMRFAGRLILGTIGSFFAGIGGFFYHLYKFIRSDDDKRSEHFGSMGVDFLRMITGGALPGLGYAISPDSYFATGEGRVDTGTGEITTVPKKRHALANEWSFGIVPLVASRDWVKEKFNALHKGLYGGYANPNTEIAMNPESDKVKCFSGRALSWLNGNQALCRIFNPENKWGNISMGIPRFIVGAIVSSVAGAIGFVYHLIHALYSLAAKDGHAKEHLKSALADLLRISGIGGLGYMLKPDAYFAQGEGRIDPMHPNQIIPVRRGRRDFHLLETELGFIPLIAHAALSIADEKGGNKVKSFSGRALSSMSTNTWMNPESTKGYVGMVIPRLLVGAVTSFVSGITGFVYHTLQAIHHFLADDDHEKELKHLKSAGADLFRCATFGIPTGLTFALAPNRYIPKGVERDGTFFDPSDPRYEPSKVVNHAEAMHPLKFEIPVYWLYSLYEAYQKGGEIMSRPPPQTRSSEYETYDIGHRTLHGTFVGPSRFMHNRGFDPRLAPYVSEYGD